MRILLVSLLFAARMQAAITMPGEGEHWSRLDSGNLVIFSNDLDGVTRRVAENIERMRLTIAHVTQLNVRIPMPMYVFLFRSDAGFGPYRDAVVGPNREVAGILMRRQSAYYMLLGSGNGEIQRVVYHEIAHSFLENTVAGLPPWLNEGLAEFYSTYQPFADSVRIGLPLKEHLRFLGDHGVMPLRELFAFRPLTHGEGDLRTNQFYAESWLLAHYMLVGNPTRGAQLGDFLTRLDQGQPPEAACQAAFHTSIDDFGRELNAYRNRSLLSFMSYSLQEIGPVTIGKPKPIARTEILTAFADLLQQTPAAADSQAFLREAIKLDPNNARAIALLGLQTGDDAMLDRAVAIDTPDYRPFVDAAGERVSRLQSVARDGTPVAPPLIAEIRRIALLAQKRAPDNPDVLGTLGATYTFPGEDARLGIQWSAKSYALAPSRVDVAADLVLLYARAGKPDLAKAMFDGVLVPSHNQHLIAQARENFAVAEFDAALELLQADKKDEAAKRFARARDLTSNDKLKQAIEARLAKTTG
jgi:tetratricopeptide (TPR) repeat protein